MKDLFKILGLLVIVFAVYIYRNTISGFINENIILRGNNHVLTYNGYYLNNDYMYVQNIDTNSVSNYQEVLNILYTTINSGDDSFSFSCNYDKCAQDVKDLIDDGNIISNLNNFVHPYNSFSTINIDISSINMVTVKTKKVYNDSEIDFINEYINNFIDKNINDTMSDYDKIKVFHDYVINNTIYDEESKDESYTAYNLIKTGKSICGGYSDIMSIYLNTIGIKNYKITSENHIWNLVYLNDSWYHLDATWDDPVASDGKQYLLHNYFLISTDQLLDLDKVEHNFDSNIYIEAR